MGHGHRGPSVSVLIALAIDNIKGVESLRRVPIRAGFFSRLPMSVCFSLGYPVEEGRPPRAINGGIDGGYGPLGVTVGVCFYLWGYFLLLKYPSGRIFLFAVVFIFSCCLFLSPPSWFLWQLRALRFATGPGCNNPNRSLLHRSLPVSLPPSPRKRVRLLWILLSVRHDHFVYPLLTDISAREAQSRTACCGPPPGSAIPGDFEVWVGNKVQKPPYRTRAPFFPPFWKLDNHYILIDFSGDNSNCPAADDIGPLAVERPV